MNEREQSITGKSFPVYTKNSLERLDLRETEYIRKQRYVNQLRRCIDFNTYGENKVH